MEVTLLKMEINKRKNKVLVTGGAGYIGSHTVVSLVEKGFTPIILDDYRNSDPKIIQKLEKLTQDKIEAIPADCQDFKFLNEFFSENKIDAVIHFAADKAVGESVENPIKYFDNNIGSLVTLLKAMKLNKVNNLVFSSSCTVYGQPKEIPVIENAPLGYTNPYGYTKLVGEQILEQFKDSNKSFNYIALRYFNPIGAHDSAEIGEVPDGRPNNLLPFITQTAAGIREQLTIFGNDYQTHDGTCIRDFIHVMDLADAHVSSLNYILKNPKKEVSAVNIGTGKGTSVLELIKIFEKENNIKLNFTFGNRREGDVESVYAKTNLADTLLNWRPKRTMSEAVKSAWEFEKKRLKK